MAMTNQLKDEDKPDQIPSETFVNLEEHLVSQEHNPLVSIEVSTNENQNKII